MTTTLAPPRSHAQRLAALKKGNDHRVKRAQWKACAWRAALVENRVLVIELVTDPPEAFHTMRLVDALKVLRGVGKVKIDRILKRTSCSPSKLLGGLSPRQRDAVAEEIRALNGWGRHEA